MSETDLVRSFKDKRQLSFFFLFLFFFFFTESKVQRVNDNKMPKPEAYMA